MDDRSFRLMVLEAKEGFYLSRASEQVQAKWTRENINRGFKHDLPANEVLPLHFIENFEDQHFDRNSSIIIQIIDASSCVIKASRTSVYHPDRHLIRMETVVWSSSMTPEELEEEPLSVRLDFGRRRLLYMILDKPFEMTVAAMKPWTYLCMVMRREVFTEVYLDHEELDNRLDLAMGIYKVEVGYDDQQVIANSKSLDKAYERAIWVFGEMDQMQASLAPVDSNDELKDFMKREAYLVDSVIRNWREEIGISPLSFYLELDP